MWIQNKEPETNQRCIIWNKSKAEFGYYLKDNTFYTDRGQYVFSEYWQREPIQPGINLAIDYLGERLDNYKMSNARHINNLIRYLRLYRPLMTVDELLEFISYDEYYLDIKNLGYRGSLFIKRLFEEYNVLSSK